MAIAIQRSGFPTQRSQRGVALPLIAIAMVALLAVAGLALDVSHTLANKTRLQNTTDAAALAAAKAYDQTGSIFDGNAAAMSLFGINAAAAGNQELSTAFGNGEIAITIQWSEELDPFISVGIGPYVRVIATGFDTDATLSSVLGLTDLESAATAVAGPSPTIDNACNIAPMVVCAEDPDDADLFGFEAGQLEVLKSAAGDGSDIGPGNFQLIRLDCPGGDCVRENMAGDFGGCLATDDTTETEPGNTVGPSVQGLNTRFYQYSGPVDEDDYPPDVVITSPDPELTYDDGTDTVQQNGATVTADDIDYNFEDYGNDIFNEAYTHAPPLGAFDRRVLALPVADCTDAVSGQGTLDVVGFGCYFLLQPVKQQGNQAQIFGQFIEGCNAGGIPGPDPGSGPGLYIIQLYKDPDSNDS